MYVRACLQKITVNPFLPIPLCLSNIDFSHHIQMTVPPLEDMSDCLQQQKTKQSSLDHQLPSKKPAEKKHVTTVDSSLLQLENEAMQPSKNLLICEEATSTKRQARVTILRNKILQKQSIVPLVNRNLLLILNQSQHPLLRLVE